MGRDDVSANGFCEKRSIEPCEGTKGVGQIGAGFRRDDRRGTSMRQTVLGRAFRTGKVKTEEENRTTFRLSALARVRLSTVLNPVIQFIGMISVCNIGAWVW